ncbi:MAG TPA: hypothetical protein PLY94_05015 [Gemmatimonadaceae bacterium]|nr:hypothetical protein [Gemmatimonadaceae bacterium]
MRTQRLAGFGLAAMAIALASCGESGADTSGAVRTDSAGVAIVTSPAEDRELGWQFERVGVLRDSAGEPWYFTRVHPRGVAVRGDGDVFVLDGTEPAVERFSRGGDYLGAFGRRGGGRGEYQLPVGLMFVGDTLLVRDLVKRAYARFLPDGTPLADFRLSETIGFVGELRFHSEGVWFNANIPDSTNQVMGFFTDTTRSRALHRVAVPRGRAVQFSCVGMSSSTPMFSPALVWSSAGERAAVHAQPGYEVWVYRNGGLEMSIRRSIASRAPTIDDAKVLYPDGWRVSFGGAAPDCVVPVEEVVEQQGIAAVLPQVQDVLVLPDGRLLVRRSLAAATEPVLDVFAADGGYLGTLRGKRMPLAMLPSGELLIPEPDEESGGTVVAIYRVETGS